MGKVAMCVHLDWAAVHPDQGKAFCTVMVLWLLTGLLMTICELGWYTQLC